MSLNEKYDQFYKSSQVKESLREIARDSWPKDRFQAIVHHRASGGSILDVGCGNGHLLYQFRNEFTNLIGLEYSSQRLAQAMLNLNEYNFRPVLGSAEQMSELKANSVDHVISADTIEHIPDIYAATSEIYRVMKPGATIVINTPNIAFLKKRVLLGLGRFPSTSQPNEGHGNDILYDGGHFHYFTYRSLRILLEKYGFKVVKLIGYGKLGYIHNIWPSLMSVGVQWVARKPK